MESKTKKGLKRVLPVRGNNNGVRPGISVEDPLAQKLGTRTSGFFLLMSTLPRERSG